MSVIGNQALPFNPLASSGKPRDAQRFNGDNTTTVFTLNFRVDNPTDLEVFVENVQQEPLTAYDAVGSQLIFTEAPPTGTNNIYVVYRNVEPGVYAQIPDGAVTFNKLANNIRLFTTDNFTGDGGTITYGLSSDVADANTLFVSIDGVIQRAPIHYTTTANTITFASAPPAASNVHVRHLGFRTTQSITALPANTTISQPVLESPQITGQGLFAAGSNTAPSISVAGDTNTGIYFPAADTIAFTEGGVEAMRISNTSNVGIGTTSPDLKLTVAGGFNLRNSVRAGALEIDSSGNFWVGTATTAGNIYFETGHTTSDLPSTGTARVTLNQYGLGLGATPSSGTGITFPATQVASADANTLDDYEEGSWTPVLGGAISQSGQSYTRQAGRYVKIGRLVICSLAVILSGKGTIVGNAQIKGLPFTVANDGDADGRGNRGGLSLGYFANLGVNIVVLGGFATEGTTDVNLYHSQTASASTTSINGSDLFANSTDLNGSIVYITA